MFTTESNHVRTLNLIVFCIITQIKKKKQKNAVPPMASDHGEFTSIFGTWAPYNFPAF